MEIQKSKYLLVQAEPRYWDDSSFDGIEDVGGKLVPLRKDDLIEWMIDIEKGIILNWPEVEAYIHYKVCDGGEYFLLDENFNKIAKENSYYVPNKFLCHGDNGYGDYVIFRVNKKGEIQEYKIPKINEEEWELIKNGRE